MAEERASKRINTHDGASSSSSTTPQGEEIGLVLMQTMKESSISTPVADGASSSSTASGSTYEVFLSFRGADTRLNFTDHLFDYLTDVGVQTFRDDEELRVGEEIGPDLMKAIKESSISIPIFSKGYATSKWCLIELTHMVKCMKTNNGRHTIFPIFYGVTPANVKHQTGSFEEAFLEHKDKVDERTIQEWKDALKEVAELKGLERDKIANGHEAELIKEIVKEVCMMLKKSYVSLTDDLVGMDHHREEMTKLLDISSCSGVRIVGILGMGGLGKTTIAKYMYNQLCDHFQRQCSFLEDVRENVLKQLISELQKQLISDVLKRSKGISLDIQHAFRNKKVLIVLDDVEDKSQLDKIIGSPDYFGPGSRIIVTTRNKEVFKGLKGDIIYKPSGMNDDESLFLFCKHAFGSTQPQEGYEEISREVVETVAGLPLSLKVIGSMLFGEKIEKWKAALKKLKTIPADDVQKRLKISYDTLSDNQKQMFLDIACHFIGEDITNAVYMWEDCGFSPEFEGIDVLVSLSLITMEKYRDRMDRMVVDVFRMHDQLRDLGRYIVKQENQRIALKRSRLVWSEKEAVGGLKNQSGTKNVQTLQIGYDISFGGPPPYCFSNLDFKELTKLRYLHVPRAHLKGDFNSLLCELLWLKSRSMTFTSFFPANLVVLDLSDSDIEDGWESSIESEAATNLKVLNLSECSRLTKTPDFSKFKNLERLMLSGCPKLTEIGSFGDLKSLIELNISYTGIRKFSPEDVGKMEKLEVLNCSWCRSLEGALPSGIGRLSSLRVLHLSLTEVDTLPDDVRNLGNLRKLHLYSSNVKKLPGVGIECLQKLEELNCSRCSSLEGEVPEGIWRLSSLRLLDLNNTKLTGALPKDISGMSRLETLDLGSCVKLRLPTHGLKLPISLRVLVLPFTKTALDSDSLRSLVNLRRLEFEGNAGCCCEPEGGLVDHHDNNNNNGGTPLLPTIIDMPSNLESLKLRGYIDYKEIKSCRLLPAIKFDSSSRLNTLVIERFEDALLLIGLLSGLIDLSNCQMLQRLVIVGCFKMREIAGFGNSLGSSWVWIDIRDCDSLEVLPNFSTLKKLQYLSIWECPKLREIKGLEEVLSSLKELTITCCPLLKRDELHPDLLTSETLNITFGLEGLVERLKLKMPMPIVRATYS